MLTRTAKGLRNRGERRFLACASSDWWLPQRGKFVISLDMLLIITKNYVYG